jgi:L-aminopeptidase/D-esterase-like protein
VIGGIRVGHAHCAVVRSGVTVLLPDQPMVMACDVRGGGPGTRETDALEPSTLVERVHALVLAGGSVFGLEAAGAVSLLLARQGRGLAVADGLHVPVIPSAILFDLANGGDKSWAQAGGGAEPYARLAGEALEALSHSWGEGAVGAGFGARAGSRAGGIGVASAALDGGGTVAALIAVNCFGEVTDGAPPSAGPVPFPKRRTGAELAAASTCIGAVITDMPLTRPAAKRLAMMAHDGLARAIRPIHTPFDGDAIFAIGLSPEMPAQVDPLLMSELGTRAADCVANAVRRAVRLANP